MSTQLKGAREAGRRVDELEREVVGLREEVASARAAAVLPVGREKELFNFTRDPSKRGAPFHPFFAGVIAPAMLTTGASWRADHRDSPAQRAAVLRARQGPV